MHGLAQIVVRGFIDPDQIIQTIIIDDGLQSRANRKVLFDSQYKLFGSYTGLNEKYQYMTCILLTKKLSNLSIYVEKNLDCDQSEGTSTDYGVTGRFLTFKEREI